MIWTLHPARIVARGWTLNKGEVMETSTILYVALICLGAPIVALCAHQVWLDFNCRLGRRPSLRLRRRNR